METDQLTIGFVCVGNAGRSQIATAFAERECERRNLALQLTTGGTNPADAVHDHVIQAMADVGLDLSVRTPRGITHEEVRYCDYVVTMGCDAADVCPAGWDGDIRGWDIDDPHDAGVDATAALRDEIEERVVSLFDELEERHQSTAR